MTLLKMQGITKDYKLGKTVVRALRGLDLEIGGGEIVAIMGPSGSGKSTLMHILGALDTPTGGKASIDGQDLQQLKERQLVTLRGKRVGFVFQTFNLIQTLSAQRNVELPMIFQGIRKSERARRARELLTKVGLAERMRHKPNELSGGERQRVAIARALANDPEIILADEPTGNLDTETGGPVLSLLQELSRRDGKTVIIVTHDPDAAAIADRVVRLRDGCVSAKGRAGGEVTDVPSPETNPGGRHVDEEAKASSSIDFTASEDGGVSAGGRAGGKTADAVSPGQLSDGAAGDEAADALSPGDATVDQDTGSVTEGRGAGDSHA